MKLYLYSEVNVIYFSKSTLCLSGLAIVLLIDDEVFKNISKLLLIFPYLGKIGGRREAVNLLYPSDNSFFL